MGAAGAATEVPEETEAHGAAASFLHVPRTTQFMTTTGWKLKSGMF